MTVAVYPGSFDPITLGHLDVVDRATRVFERLVLGVLVNPRKEPLLDTDRRVAIVREAVADRESAERVEVEAFEGLTVEFARSVGARWVVRGLRAVSDFELELQLAQTNRVLAPEIDAVFFMTDLELAYVSSSLAREIAGFGGDGSSLVPPAAARALVERFRSPGRVR